MFIFCALICAINRQKTTVKKKITYFMKKFVASSFTFFEKVFAAGKFFTTRCLDIRFWDVLYFICLKFNPQYWYLLLYSTKTCWFRSYFLQGKGRNFCGIFIKSQKLCLHKIFNIGLTMKVNCHEFLLFYAQCKMRITPVSLKNYSFHNLLNRLRLFLFNKKVNLKTCLCHVYVYAMVLTWTVHLKCSRICWSFF